MLDSIITANKKYYPQTFLEECKYEVKKIKQRVLLIMALTQVLLMNRTMSLIVSLIIINLIMNLIIMSLIINLIMNLKRLLRHLIILNLRVINLLVNLKIKTVL